MKFHKETLELLEIYIQTLFHRLFIVKAMGKDNDIVRALDLEIDAIKAKLTGEIS